MDVVNESTNGNRNVLADPAVQAIPKTDFVESEATNDRKLTMEGSTLVIDSAANGGAYPDSIRMYLQEIGSISVLAEQEEK